MQCNATMIIVDASASIFFLLCSLIRLQYQNDINVILILTIISESITMFDHFFRVN